MALKEYLTFLKVLELEPHHQMQFSVTSKIPPLGGIFDVTRKKYGTFNVDLTAVKTLSKTFFFNQENQK